MMDGTPRSSSLSCLLPFWDHHVIDGQACSVGKNPLQACLELGVGTRAQLQERKREKETPHEKDQVDDK